MSCDTQQTYHVTLSHESVPRRELGAVLRGQLEQDDQRGDHQHDDACQQEDAVHDQRHQLPLARHHLVLPEIGGRVRVPKEG